MKPLPEPVEPLATLYPKGACSRTKIIAGAKKMVKLGNGSNAVRPTSVARARDFSRSARVEAAKGKAARAQNTFRAGDPSAAALR